MMFNLPLMLVIAGILVVGAAGSGLCDNLGWSLWLTLLLFIPAVGLVFAVVLAWQALPRLGHSRALVLLAGVPVAGRLMLVWLAVQRWPKRPLLIEENTGD